MPRQRKIKHYRYGYPGRRHRRSGFLRVLLFLLLLALLIFVGYCITKAVGDLMDRDTESEAPSEPSVSVSALPGADSSLEEPDPSSASESPGMAARTPLRAVVMPRASMASLDAVDAFLDTVDKSLYNSVAVELKGSDGTLYYQSEVELASQCKAVGANALDAKELCQRIAAKGFEPVAKIYALLDDVASHSSYATSYLYNDQASVTWLDRAADKGGKSWLNPYMANTVDYLKSISGELGQAGFKTVLAYGIQYPDTKYSQEMGFGPDKTSMTTTEALQNVLDQMETEAAKHGGIVVPAYQGEEYLAEMSKLYTDSPNVFKAEETSPILPKGKEAEVLGAVTADSGSLAPSISSAELIPLLKEKGIEQYIVG